MLAVVEGGIRSDQFWSLSFYDWSLLVLKIRSGQEKRRQDSELLIELERSHMAWLGVANGVKKQDGTSFTKYDFFGGLSYDTTPAAAPVLSSEETMSKIKNRFRKYLKE